jgi:protocatechuate 3,4-dioxygenase beta subunit
MQTRTIFTFVTLIVTAAAVAAQDVDYIRAIERAQKERPTALAASARIAATGEPGTPLVLRGRVVTENGTPAPDAVVFAYQTDRTGVYDRREAGAHSWRLKGWAKADKDGRFRFDTIRPGSYPNSNNPAHVHFTVFLPSGERFHAGEIRFGNDPLVPQHDRDAGARDEFEGVRPVAQRGGSEHVEFGLRLRGRDRF